MTSTAQQVSGSEKTLLRCIGDGEIPKPALMQWNEWQVWRRDVGKRPSAAIDGEATSSGQESALWKAVMLEYYGPDWLMQLATRGEAPAENVVPPVRSDGAGMPTDAGASGNKHLF